MNTNKMELIEEYPIKNTFYSHNNIATSQIDYFMHKVAERSMQYKVTIKDMEPLNVSDHTLVITEIKGTIARKERTIDKTIKRTNWKKCDKQLYQDIVSSKLSEIELNVSNTAKEIIDKLENIFHEAGKSSIPNYRKEIVI